MLALPFPVVFLADMDGESLRNLGHAINRDSQLAVIRQHANHHDERLRELCKGWAATADIQNGKIRWRTTDSIQRWRRVITLQPDLLCATEVNPVTDIDHWGVLNVLSVLLPSLMSPERGTSVVMPQTKTAVYYTSTAVQAAVVGVLAKPSNWKLATDLISHEDRP